MSQYHLAHSETFLEIVFDAQATTHQKCLPNWKIQRLGFTFYPKGQDLEMSVIL